MFLRAAYAEFSTKGFYGASLTQLVKDLGIAKGSLYQYFDDKQEIYHHLVIEACKHRLTFFGVLQGKPSEDYLFNYLVISLKFDVTYPQMGAIIYGAFSSLENDVIKLIDQEFCRKVPQQYLSKGIPAILVALGNFAELITRQEINLSEIIRDNSEITVSSDEIIKIVESNKIKI